MFTILKEESPITVKKINILIYGQPGIGKTSLAFTTNNPILLDTDKGAHRATNKKDIIIIQSWADINSNIKMFTEAIKPYNTVIIDTVDKLLQYMMTDIKLNNPRIKDGRMLYGQLKDTFSQFFAIINNMDKDVILLAHEVEKENNNGDTVIRPQVTGSTLGLLIQETDLMGRMFMRNNQRVIDFVPSSEQLAKDASIGIYTVPSNDDMTLDSIIKQTKEEFEGRIKRKQELKEIAKEYVEKIKDIQDVSTLNDYVKQLKKSPETIKSLLRAHIVAKAADLGAVLKGNEYVQNISITT